MIPVLFHIGPLTVYSYGLMMALGFIAADCVVTLECRRRGLSRRFRVVDDRVGGDCRNRGFAPA